MLMSGPRDGVVIPAPADVAGTALPALILAGALINLTGANTVPAKPHVIFMLADDLGYGNVGYTRNGARESYVATPTIDRLADTGVYTIVIL